jgi:Tfp pilus assembly protein PilE
MREQRGYTLIELIVLILLLGASARAAFLASFATDDPRVNALKTDLVNLATVEEAYFAAHQTYTTMFTSSQYNPSTGVNVSITSVGPSGWSATATHNRSTTSCAITAGAGSVLDRLPVCR